MPYIHNHCGRVSSLSFQRMKIYAKYWNNGKTMTTIPDDTFYPLSLLLKEHPTQNKLTSGGDVIVTIIGERCASLWWLDSAAQQYIQVYISTHQSIQKEEAYRRVRNLLFQSIIPHILLSTFSPEMACGHLNILYWLAQAWVMKGRLTCFLFTTI